MTIKVNVVSSQSINVSLKSKSLIKVNTILSQLDSVASPTSLNDLEDFNPSGVQDKYLVMYDAATQKYVTVNPDVVLSAASNTETTQPGLPQDFIDTLDVDLDNKIDLDAGGF
jgi:hypothetical protein